MRHQLDSSFNNRDDRGLESAGAVSTMSPGVSANNVGNRNSRLVKTI